jgi:hypothetical protein
MRYFKKKKGAGGSIREELMRQSASNVSKAGRSFNTTTSSAIMNSRLMNPSVNGVRIRMYPVTTLMTGSYSSEAEA